MIKTESPGKDRRVQPCRWGNGAFYRLRWRETIGGRKTTHIRILLIFGRWRRRLGILQKRRVYLDVAEPSEVDIEGRNRPVTVGGISSQSAVHKVDFCFA